MFIIYKHTKLEPLVSSLALEKVKEIGALTEQGHVYVKHVNECTCKFNGMPYAC